MADLIDDLLRLSYSSKAPLVWGTVDLNQLIAGVIADFDQETRSHPVEWDRQALPIVSGDPSLLRLVFINLLANALKYPRRQNPAKITVGARDRTLEE